MIEGEDLYYSGGIDRDRLKMGPVIIDEASWDSKAMGEEIFGPILPMIEFDDLRRVKKELEGRPKPLALYLHKVEGFHEIRHQEYFFWRRLHQRHHHAPGHVQHAFWRRGRQRHGEIITAVTASRTFTHEKSVLHKSNLIDVPLRYPPYGRDTKWLRLFLK